MALAANYLGHLIQRGLDVVYFFADLHGTLSPPVFLDRLGATIVNATRTPGQAAALAGLGLSLSVPDRERSAVPEAVPGASSTRSRP